MLCRFSEKSNILIWDCHFCSYDLMSKCWLACPADRPTFSQLRENLISLLEQMESVLNLHSICFEEDPPESGKCGKRQLIFRSLPCWFHLLSTPSLRHGNGTELCWLHPSG